MKGPLRQKQTQEQNRKEWTNSVGKIATPPPREGEPAGTRKEGRKTEIKKKKKKKKKKGEKKLV